MRTRVILVSLALLAAPAMIGHAAPRLPAGLRGPVSTSATVFTMTSAPSSPPLRPRLAALAPPVNASATSSQCRTACAHSYYFCPSDPAAIDCAATWSQCVTGCGHPPLTLAH